MKKQHSKLFTAISNASIENLTAGVLETLATGYTHCNSKPFNAIDLWNIHRQKRGLISRRQF